jgi:23S rRNA (adenine2503-C2)-methyltransferase
MFKSDKELIKAVDDFYYNLKTSYNLTTPYSMYTLKQWIVEKKITDQHNFCSIVNGRDMQILKNVKTPTGNILIVQGKGRPLECLSVGDYGKEKNIKADFLGLSEEINGVPHGDLIPLEEKWVITISTQSGCSVGCQFCDVPKVGKGYNANVWDMFDQVMTCIDLHPEVKHTKRLNVHFARMGEPTYNWDVHLAAVALYREIKEKRGWGYHPVVSTMCPNDNTQLEKFIREWIAFKIKINGEAGLQLSINTTDENERANMFNGKALSLIEISEMMSRVLIDIQKYTFGYCGRKIALNFALTDKPIEAELLRKLFDPKYFLCKITPMHMTTACKDNDMVTRDGYEQYYPYAKVEKELKEVGFDVIVFVPSKEEDESRITCGNAILADEKV